MSHQESMQKSKRKFDEAVMKDEQLDEIHGGITPDENSSLKGRWKERSELPELTIVPEPNPAEGTGGLEAGSNPLDADKQVAKANALNSSGPRCCCFSRRW